MRDNDPESTMSNLKLIKGYRLTMKKKNDSNPILTS